jgi:hypothetical protein
MFVVHIDETTIESGATSTLGAGRPQHKLRHIRASRMRWNASQRYQHHIAE